jgi:hypothetical protein
LIAVAVCLGLVILAPIALSGQDLYDWANSPKGLALDPWFAGMVPVALDLAAAACIGMVIVGTIWRRERPGAFGALVWVFAGLSAWAQYRHGVAARDAGGAQDAWWLFPALALLGPTLLEVTLARMRRWARIDTEEQHHGAAGFGARWIPGVALRETLKAWAASRREGIDQAPVAVAHVREVQALRGLSVPDAVAYAVDAIGSRDRHTVRLWLQARGVEVDRAALDAVGLPTLIHAELITDDPTGVIGDAERILRAVPISPGAPADLSTVSRTAAVAWAHLALGRDVPAGRIVAYLAERGVHVSESLVYKARRAASELGGDMSALVGPTGDYPIITAGPETA